MNKTILIALLFAAANTSSQSHAQSVNTGIQISHPVVQVTYEPVRVLVAQTDNVIRLETQDTSVKRWLVNTNQGTVTQRGKDFIIRPDNPGIISLSIFDYSDIENPRYLEEKKFKVVFPPAAVMGGRCGGEISLEELLKINKIGCLGLENSFHIKTYQISLSGKEIDYKTFECQGEFLKQEITDCFKQLLPGDKIYVEYIRAEGKDDGTQINVPPLIFTLIQ